MIVNCQRRIPVSVGPLTKFCEEVRQALRFPTDSVTVRLVSDTVIARLNRDFRGKHGPTDVLSFPAERHRRYKSKIRNNAKAKRTVAGPDQVYVGDIAISPQTAKRNARRGGHALSVELRILILHGMIHLAGYDHETDHGEMDRFERRMRCRTGLR